MKSKEPGSHEFRHEDFQGLKDYVKKTKGILDKINTGTEEEPAEPGPTGYVPNLLE